MSVYEVTEIIHLTHAPLSLSTLGTSLSPLKTPSKALLMTMVETPQATPLKGTEPQASTETALTLDEAPFVDHQVERHSLLYSQRNIDFYIRMS